MRPTKLCAALLLCSGIISGAASGQVVSLVGGTSFASSSEHDGTRQGRLFGVRLTLPLTDRIALRFGPDFADHNLPQREAGALAPNQYRFLAYETSNLELPVLLKLSLGTGSISPHVLAGAAFGVRVRCQVESTVLSYNAFGQITSYDSSAIGCGDDPIGQSANRLQVDARVGIGVDVSFDPVVATIEVVYGAGVRKIFETFAAQARTTFLRVGVGVPLR